MASDSADLAQGSEPGISSIAQPHDILKYKKMYSFRSSYNSLPSDDGAGQSPSRPRLIRRYSLVNLVDNEIRDRAHAIFSHWDPNNTGKVSVADLQTITGLGEKFCSAIGRVLGNDDEGTDSLVVLVFYTDIV
jgi:hypothetical protein